jgi:hypothetical protein
MIGEKQRPLTVRALVTYMETLETELEKTTLPPHKQDSVMDGVMSFFPRSPGGGHWKDEDGPNPRRFATWTGSANVPETMEALRALTEHLKERGHFNGEPSRAYEIEIEKACGLAVQAAEKSMQTESFRSR